MKSSETGLENDCGLIAAATYHWLKVHDVPARVLNVRYGKMDGHSIVVFESGNGRLCTFDYDGSMTLDRATTWKTKPTLMARAWAKAMGSKRIVQRGKWL